MPGPSTPHSKSSWLLAAIILISLKSSVSDMMWERDVGDDMVIHPTTEGYKRVDLRCGAEHMHVEVETEDNFQGVIYTRGSFAKKKSPCFKDVTHGKIFSMKIPFDNCKTENKDNVFTNTLILQHDDDLIMPGDAAFSLECDFSKPRDIPLHGSMPTELFDVLSKISLSNADPTVREIPEEMKMFVTNKSTTVSFRPRFSTIQKDEL